MDEQQQLCVSLVGRAVDGDYYDEKIAEWIKKSHEDHKTIVIN